jgi:hypothetical protein
LSSPLPGVPSSPVSYIAFLSLISRTSLRLTYCTCSCLLVLLSLPPRFLVVHHIRIYDLPTFFASSLFLRWRFVVPSVLSPVARRLHCPSVHRRVFLSPSLSPCAALHRWLASLISFVGCYTPRPSTRITKLHSYLHPGRPHSAVCVAHRPVTLPAALSAYPPHPFTSTPLYQTVFLSSFSLQLELSSCLLRSLLLFTLCASHALRFLCSSSVISSRGCCAVSTIYYRRGPVSRPFAVIICCPSLSLVRFLIANDHAPMTRFART